MTTLPPLPKGLVLMNPDVEQPDAVRQNLPPLPKGLVLIDAPAPPSDEQPEPNTGEVRKPLPDGRTVVLDNYGKFLRYEGKTKSERGGFDGPVGTARAVVEGPFAVVSTPGATDKPESGIIPAFKRGLGDFRNDLEISRSINADNLAEWESIKTKHSQTAQRWADKVPRSVDVNKVTGAERIVKGVPEDVAGMLGPMIVSRFLDMFTGGAPVASVSQWTAQGRGQALAKALEGIDTSKLSKRTAAFIDAEAWGVGAAYAAVEQINRFGGKSGNDLLKKMIGDSKWKKYFAGVAGESLEEGLQDALMNSFVNLVRTHANNDLPESERKELMSAGKIALEAGKTALQSVPAVMALGGGQAAIEKITGGVASPENAQQWAENNPEAAKKLVESPDPASRKAVADAVAATTDPELAKKLAELKSRKDREAWASAVAEHNAGIAAEPAKQPPVSAEAPAAPAEMDELQALTDKENGIPGVVEPQPLTPDEQMRKNELSISPPPDPSVDRVATPFGSDVKGEGNSTLPQQPGAGPVTDNGSPTVAPKAEAEAIPVKNKSRIGPVFHGTTSRFDIKDIKEGYGKSFKTRGIMFTSNKDVARAFTGEGQHEIIHEAYLDIKNPLIVDAKGSHWLEIEFEGEKIDVDSLADIARSRGNDGVVVKNIQDVSGLWGDTTIALNPDQIKTSAEDANESAPKPESKPLVGRKQHKPVQTEIKGVENAFSLVSDQTPNNEKIMADQEKAAEQKAERERQQGTMDFEAKPEEPASPVNPVQIEQEVVKAKKEAYAAASSAYAKAVKKYRSKKIDDAEFLAARKARDEAMSELENAEKALAKAEKKAKPRVGKKRLVSSPIDAQREQVRDSLAGRIRMPKKGEQFHGEAQDIPIVFRAKKGSNRPISPEDAINDANQFLPGNEIETVDQLIDLLKGKLVTEAEAKREINSQYSEGEKQAENDALNLMVEHLGSEEFMNNLPSAEFDQAVKDYPKQYAEAKRIVKSKIYSETEGVNYDVDPFDPNDLTGNIGAAGAVNVKGDSGVIGQLFDGTGTKNDYTKEMQKRLGQVPESFGPKPDEALLEEVNGILQKNENAGTILIKRMKEKPFIPTDAERLVLLREAIVRENAVNDAIERKDMAAAGVAQDALYELYSATQQGSAEWGRAGRAMRMMADEDFSLKRLIYVKKKISGDISAEELAKLKDQADRAAKQAMAYYAALKKKEAELDAEQQKSAGLETELAAKEVASKEFKALVEELKREGEARAKRNFDAAQKSESRRKSMSDTADRLIEEALASMKARASKMSANPALDPSILVDLGKLGTGYILKGIVGIDAWAAKVRQDFAGIDIEDKIDEYYLRSVRDAEKQTSNVAGDAAPADKKPSGKGAKLSMKQRVRAQIENNVHDFDKIFKNIQADLTDLSGNKPSIRELHDEFSGYNKKKKTPSTDPVDEELARLRTKAQLIEKINDAKRGVRPHGIGSEFYKSNAEERDLNRQLRDLLRDDKVMGPKTEEQLANGLDMAKRRMLNEIEDMQRDLDRGKKRDRKTNPVQYDAEAKEIETRLKAKRAEYNEIFKKPELTIEQKLELAIRAAERNATYWESRQERAAKGEFGAPKKEGVALPASEAMDAAKRRVEAAKAEVKRLYEVANPPMTEWQKYLKSYGQRLDRQIAAGEKRVAAKDFGPKPFKAPLNISQYPDLMELKTKWEKTKMEIRAGQEQDRYNAMNGLQQAGEIWKYSYNLLRFIKLSFDDSMMGKQGWFFAMSHPIEWAKTLSSLKALSRTESSKLYQQHLEREVHRMGLDEIMKIRFNEANANGDFREVDDMLSKNLSKFFKDHVPGLVTAVAKAPVEGLDASNRLAGTTGNKIRSGFGDLLLKRTEIGREILAKKGRNLTEKQVQFLQDVGAGVNVLTGRSTWNLGPQTSWFLLAPRFFLSTVQALYGHPILMAKTSEARKAFALEYTRAIVGGLGLVYGLAMLTKGDDDDDIEFDPRSSNWGAIPHWGNFNPLQVIKPTIVFLAQTISGQKKVGQKNVNLREGGLWFATDLEKKQGVAFGGGYKDVLGKFAQSKLHNTLGLAITLASGEGYSGKKMGPSQAIVDAVTPITAVQLAESVQTQSPVAATLSSIAGIFGFGVSPDWNSYKVVKYQAGSEEEFKKKVENMSLDRMKEMFDSATPEERKELLPALETKMGRMIWSASDSVRTGREKESIQREAKKLAMGGKITAEMVAKAKETVAKSAEEHNAKLKDKQALLKEELAGLPKEEALRLLKRYTLSNAESVKVREITGKRGLTEYGRRKMEIEKLYKSLP